MPDYFARVTYPNVSGSQADFSVPFPYLLTSHVEVYSLGDGEELEDNEPLVEDTDYEWTSASVIHFAANPSAGHNVTLKRVTPRSPLTELTGPAVVLHGQLNAVDLQAFYLIQEALDDSAILNARALRVGEGDSVALVPVESDRAGKLLGFDAGGDPVALEVGVDGDLSIRTDLAGDAGFTLVKHKSGLANTYGRTGRQWALMGGLDNRNIYNWIDPDLDSEVLDGTNTEPLTASVQAFVDHLADKHYLGHAHKGTFLVDDTIVFPETYGWGILGGGQEAAIFEQATDNIPIFDLGPEPVDSMHSYILKDLQFTYSNVQTAANTGAICILFSAANSPHQGQLKSIRFYRGHYAISVLAGTDGPWGQDWDNLRFYGELSGGAIDMTGATRGVPNNKWGRFVVQASSMTDIIFKEIKGYNWTIQNIEILDATNIELFRWQAGADVDIGSMKLELATYDDAVPGNHLLNAQVGSSVRLGSFHLGGTWCVLTPAVATYLIGGAGGRFEIGHVVIGATEAPSNFYIYGGAKEGLIRELEFSDGGFGVFTVPLTNIAASDAANKVTVLPDKNDRLSDNKGDANYAIVQGDPAVISFETALTAPRTVALPVDDAQLFNGLRYRVISNGAVNGANTLTIAADGNTKATIRDAYGYVDLEWRRVPFSPHTGWKVVGSGSTRPGAHAVVPTANLPAAAAAMDGTVLIEDAGAGDRNFVFYAGAQRFRVDGGANF